MTEEQRQRRREYQKRWQAENADRVRESRKRAREQNPEKERERNRSYAERNQAKLHAYRRQYWAGNRERLMAEGARKRHGPFIDEDRAAMWAAQDGKCYLCGCELIEGQAPIDHDHRCCPKDQSCRVCRRGIACNNCNVAVGMVGDDPDRLRRMADGIEAALRAVEERMCANQQRQIELFSAGSTA